MIQLTHQFGNYSRFSNSEEARRKVWFTKARQDKLQREELAAEVAESAIAFATTVIMATEAQIEAFEARLDLYDQATTAALMDNQIEFEQLQERLAEIEAGLEGVWPHANIMPDGRRAFLNADRSQAYDEFGKPVADAEYSYDLFPKNHRPVDGFLNQLKERGEIHDAMKNNRLEREQIHEFDDLTNQHREEIAQGGISEDRLNEMDEELLGVMPPSVKKQLPGFENPSNAPDLKSGFSTSVTPETIMHPTAPSTRLEPL